MRHLQHGNGCAQVRRAGHPTVRVCISRYRTSNTFLLQFFVGWPTDRTCVHLTLSYVTHISASVFCQLAIRPYVCASHVIVRHTHFCFDFLLAGHPTVRVCILRYRTSHTFLLRFFVGLPSDRTCVHLTLSYVTHISASVFCRLAIRPYVCASHVIVHHTHFCFDFLSAGHPTERVCISRYRTSHTFLLRFFFGLPSDRTCVHFTLSYVTHISASIFCRLAIRPYVCASHVIVCC